MHFSVLVVAEDVIAALADFRYHDDAPGYARECWCRRQAERAFRESALAKTSCRTCKGEGTLLTNANPIGRWDSFIAIHGRFRRRPGVTATRRSDEYEGLCSLDWIGDGSDRLPARLASFEGLGDWDQARKRDLDLASMRSDGFLPYAVLLRDVWHQADWGWWFPSVHAVTARVTFGEEAAWPARFDGLLREVPDDAVLTLVDCHG